MITIKLTDKQFNKLIEIKSFELGLCLVNNELQINNDETYLLIYDSLLKNADDSKIIQNFLPKYLKYDIKNIIKPFDLNTI